VINLATCRVLTADERAANPSTDASYQLKRTGHHIPQNDTWIAALARQHNSPLVTRDQHFDFVPGLTRLNW
jgi:predicted nucleic acid-binding protein